jgi:hypothetical protein
MLREIQKHPSDWTGETLAGRDVSGRVELSVMAP